MGAQAGRIKFRPQSGWFGQAQQRPPTSPLKQEVRSCLPS